ncbi:MAG: glycosyltransferase family 2 protein [Planctomycetes bacterium]|nr:glycosyltransferase family 2 protein [Planctomycetota bacterium]
MPDENYEQTPRPELSVVIPAYNEARRIRRTLTAVRAYAMGAAVNTEIIVVDDGSRDETAEIVRSFESQPLTTRLLVNPANRGKGYSVRQGMLSARGDVMLMCDADLSAPIEEFERLRPWLEQGYHVVIGSRDLPDSRLAPPQPLLRRWLAWGFRGIRRRLLLPALRDTQCGFKCFRRSVAREVFSHQQTDGWLFDCEVLGLADRLGYRVKEVGIVWRNDPDSRVNTSWEVLRALPTLLAIRRRLAAIARREPDEGTGA